VAWEKKRKGDMRSFLGGIELERRGGQKERVYGMFA